MRPGEKAIRAAVNFLGDDLHREMRRGGRTALFVQLEVPHLPEKRLTVVTPHLENRTKPKNRRKQMHEVLEWARDAPNPVVIAGDLNTTTGDSQAFKLERALYKKYTDPDYYRRWHDVRHRHEPW